MRTLDGGCRTAVRAVAAFDLAVTAVLATPGLAQAFLALVMAIDAALGLATPTPALDATGWLFVNLAGLLGVLWNGLRWQDPQPRQVRWDAAGRVAVSAWIIGYVALADISPVFLLFVVSELGGAAVAVLALRPAPARTP